MNKDIKGKGFVNEGIVSTKLGMKGIPALAETIELSRNIALLIYTGGKMMSLRYLAPSLLHSSKKQKQKD